MKQHELSVQITNLKSNSHDELEQTFAQMEGVTNPGLDEPSEVFKVTYDPEFITAQIILDKLRDMRYEHGDIRDEEI